MAKKGICTLCGKGGKLSFEHVPPRATFNPPGAVMYGIDDWLNRSATGELPGGVPQPEGTGVRGLCEPCNRFLGDNYVPEFARFVHGMADMLRGLGDVSAVDASPAETYIKVKAKQVDTSVITKQMVAMLLTINGREFAVAHPGLTEFVLDTKATGIDSRYKLYINVCYGPFLRSAGLSTMLKLDTKEANFLTELAAPPLSYVLTIDSAELFDGAGDVTAWTKDLPGTKRDVEMVMLFGFSHTPFPGDLRSMGMIEADRKKNTAIIDGGEIDG